MNARKLFRRRRGKRVADSAPPSGGLPGAANESFDRLDLAQVVVPEECEDWRQADVVRDVDALPVIGDDGAVSLVACDHGFAILSQSCDASQTNRETVQLAKVVTLGGTVASEARRGRRPRYAPLPGLGESYFADLDVVATATKGSLVPMQRTTGAPDDEHVNRFSGTAARKVGRFAFPDAVVETFRPFQDDLFEKSKKTGSPMNKVINDVRAFRVRATDNWASEPHDLNVHAILAPGAIPTFADDAYPEQPNGMRNNLLGGKEIADRLPQIVACLVEPDIDEATRYWAWQMLAEAWGQRCMAAARKAGVDAKIASVSVELYVYDEYTLDLVDSTERLDLDYLSEPSAGSTD